MATTPQPPPSGLVPGLLKTLVVLLATGDLLWFGMTSPLYFKWPAEAWVSSALPLILLWSFIGLPSLLLGLIMMRLAGRGAGLVLKASYLAIVLVCALVPLLGSYAFWLASPVGTRFPMVVWGSVIIVAILLMALGFWGTSKLDEKTRDSSN